MSIKIEFATLGGALSKEVRSFSPYAMATIVGYGRIGGYSPRYSEIRHDIFEYLEIAGATLERPDFGRALDLQPIIRNRMMGENLFADERDTLSDALEAMAEAARGDSDSIIAEQLGVMQPGLDRRFRRLQRRAGLGFDRRAAMGLKRTAPKLPPRMLPKPEAPAAPQDEEPLTLTQPLSPVQQKAAEIAAQLTSRRQAPRNIGDVAAPSDEVLQLCAPERQRANEIMVAAAARARAAKSGFRASED